MKQKNNLIIKYLPADYKDCFWMKSQKNHICL